jgi:hypothetical protein
MTLNLRRRIAPTTMMTMPLTLGFYATFKVPQEVWNPDLHCQTV